MTITLYTVPASGYGSKVRLAMRLKGLEWRELGPPDGYGSAAYKEIVPAGTVPAIDDDGFVLAESGAIVEYLNERVPEPPLLPADLQARAQARELSRFHDTRLEPQVRALYRQANPETRDIATCAWQGMAINDRLIQLGDLVSPSPFLSGNRPGLADLGYPATFHVIDVLSRMMDFSIDWPAPLARYREALETDPVIAVELEVYRAGLGQWARSKGYRADGSPA